MMKKNIFILLFLISNLMGDNITYDFYITFRADDDWVEYKLDQKGGAKLDNYIKNLDSLNKEELEKKSLLPMRPDKMIFKAKKEGDRYVSYQRYVVSVEHGFLSSKKITKNDWIKILEINIHHGAIDPDGREFEKALEAKFIN